MKKIKDKSGYVSVWICILMPVIILIIGFCIDGSIAIYYRSKLMTSTKVAAISATTVYQIENSKLVIQENKARDVAIQSLAFNFSEATITNVYVDSIDKNTCTVESRVEAPIFFMNISEIFGVTIEDIVFNESYTASRSVLDGGE